MNTSPSNPRGLEFINRSTRIAKWLDSHYLIPGTSIRFGLDPLLGLVPIIGDAVGLFMSLSLVFTMILHGARGKVIALMISHSLVDALLGSLPLIGPFFDVWYKANQRNINLLKEHNSVGKHQSPATSVIVFWMIFFLVVFGGTLTLITYSFLEILNLIKLLLGDL